jgi:hypothetical protein
MSGFRQPSTPLKRFVSSNAFATLAAGRVATSMQLDYTSLASARTIQQITETDQSSQCFTEFCFESRRQARFTEAARSDWLKARLALGNLLEKNSILNLILSNRILRCLDYGPNGEVRSVLLRAHSAKIATSGRRQGWRRLNCS